MDVSLVESLRERYPQVFGELTRAEAGNGWYSLLDRLGAELSSGPGPYSSIRLFKEKFGELRFGKVSVRPELWQLLAGLPSKAGPFARYAGPREPCSLGPSAFVARDTHRLSMRMAG